MLLAIKRFLLVATGVASLLWLAAGCTNTPHLYKPLHLNDHFMKIFSPEDGELHTLHVDLDRVLFGVENYRELETTEYIYSE